MICFKVPIVSCSAIYGEKKTYKQVPQPASPLHGKNQTPRVYRKSPPCLAPKIIKPQTQKETKHKNVEVERHKPLGRLTKRKEKTLTARNAGRGERIDERRHRKTHTLRAHQKHFVQSGRSLHRSKALDNRHGGSAIPPQGVTGEGPTDGKDRERAEALGRGDASRRLAVGCQPVSSSRVPARE